MTNQKLNSEYKTTCDVKPDPLLSLKKELFSDCKTNESSQWKIEYSISVERDSTRAGILNLVIQLTHKSSIEKLCMERITKDMWTIFKNGPSNPPPGFKIEFQIIEQELLRLNCIQLVEIPKVTKSQWLSKYPKRE